MPRAGRRKLAPLSRMGITAAALVMAGAAACPSHAQEGLPEPVTLDRFEHLFDAPPFRRLLSLSDRLVLSGVAQLPGSEMVTLLNPATDETFVVTRTPNPRGWRLVELVSDDDLLKVSATISAGGRDVTLRFDPRRLRPRSSRSGTRPGREDETHVVLEALLRRLDREAADSFENLEPDRQEEFRQTFATYLKTYPESSDDRKVEFARETLAELAAQGDEDPSGGAGGAAGGGEDSSPTGPPSE